MKKKTALQQLIEQLESMKPQSQIVDFIKEQATELLETEREQIEEAHTNGVWTATDFLDRKPLKTSNQYYKDTYK
jgi:NAD/NADP transhydrogenase alpha subunit